MLKLLMHHNFLQHQSWSNIRNIIYICALTISLSSCDSSIDGDVQYVDLDNRLSSESIESKSAITPTKDTFYFGFDRRNSAQEDAAQYLPFLDYLSRTTGYNFKLHFTPQNKRLVDELGDNTVQFAAMGAMGFIEARALFDVIPLARGLNEQDKAEYQSFFVVKPNSKIKVLADIKGHHLALGNRASTQGHLIPRVIIKEQGLSLSDLKRISYTGSHANCIETVLREEADVCGVQDTLAMNYAKQGKLRIIHKSAFYPSSGISANHQVSNDVINKVKVALLEFDPLGKDSSSLYHWDKTEMPHGFTAANNEDYTELQKWAITFGFIHLDEK